jgi:hypothetical protein
MQASEQKTEQQPRPAHLYRPGQSGNPRGRESAAARQVRRDALMALWAEPVGGLSMLKPAELGLLQRAADLYLKPLRRGEDPVRSLNTVSKILALIGLVDRRRKRERPAATPNPHRPLAVAAKRYSEAPS